jgi:hypothetical protein
MQAWRRNLKVKVLRRVLDRGQNMLAPRQLPHPAIEPLDERVLLAPLSLPLVKAALHVEEPQDDLLQERAIRFREGG